MQPLDHRLGTRVLTEYMTDQMLPWFSFCFQCRLEEWRRERLLHCQHNLFRWNSSWMTKAVLPYRTHNQQEGFHYWGGFVSSFDISSLGFGAPGGPSVGSAGTSPAHHQSGQLLYWRQTSHHVNTFLYQFIFWQNNNNGLCVPRHMHRPLSCISAPSVLDISSTIFMRNVSPFIRWGLSKIEISALCLSDELCSSLKRRFVPRRSQHRPPAGDTMKGGLTIPAEHLIL